MSNAITVASGGKANRCKCPQGHLSSHGKQILYMERDSQLHFSQQSIASLNVVAVAFIDLGMLHQKLTDMETNVFKIFMRIKY